MKLDPNRLRVVLAQIEEDERAAEFHDREAKRLRASAAARRKVWGLSDQSHTSELDSNPSDV